MGLMSVARIVRITFACTVLALTLLGASSATSFTWPDPRKHPRVILTANQSLADDMEAHPEWFTNDFVIGGFSIKDVPYGQSSDAIRKFAFLRQRFQRNGIIVGSYISGTTAIHELSLRQFPANAVSMEDLSVKTRYLGPWLRDPTQAVVSLSDKALRRDFENEIRILWLHVISPVRFVDNAAVHPRVAPMQPWTDYCDHMKALRIIATSLRATVIFNVFVRPWELSEQETKQLIEAVGRGNAIALPLPWSKQIKNDKNATGWAIYRYRQLLDAGIAVIMIPSSDAPTRDLIHWVWTWSKPNDLIYYSTPTWSDPPW
jgi:hypothetical protein